MAKLTTLDVTSGYASTTALNNNFSLIETALENTLSRDGTSPNTMSTDLDLNGNDILNVGDMLVGGVGLTASVNAAAASASAASGSAAAALVSETNASASEIAAELAATQVVDWDYLGAWATTTAYKINNIIYESTNGASYICLVNHTSGTFATDLGAGNWGLLATRGAAGAGTGDMLKSENLSGLANYDTARSNMGLSIGVHVQAYDAQLATLAAITAQQATDLAAVSTFMGTVLNDTDAVTARTTLQAAKEIQPVDASVAANALTLTLNPTSLDFRSSTLTSGTVNTRSIAAAISVVISSGSTLGTIAATAARLAILAIDATSLGGSVELAVVNLAGGNNLDETTLISTTAEGGAGAADSANVLYSTTARSNVPFRVVGFVDITEATAGTWTTAPTLVQGVGGQALAAMSSLGYGQTWQLVTRASGTTYYNTTGRPIFYIANTSGVAGADLTVTIGGVAVFVGHMGQADTRLNSSGIIPPGSSYVFTSAQLTSVYELR